MIESAQYEDVTQIKMSREMGGLPVYWVASYLVDGLLIDTGCNYTADELNIFLYGMKIEQIVNTHFHEDHVGGNRIIGATHKAPIYAHPDSIPLIAKKQKLCPYQEMIWGYPAPSQALPVAGNIKTENYEFEVIETPGHSAGHIALVEKSKGWCFPGDIFASVNLKVARNGEDMGEIIKSMEKLLSANTNRLTLFTSTGKIIENGREAFAAFTKYLMGLSEKSRKLVSKGYDIDGIVREIFGGEHAFAELTNREYSSANLIEAVMKI